MKRIQIRLNEGQYARLRSEHVGTLEELRRELDEIRSGAHE
jgi:hypothetical protein